MAWFKNPFQGAQQPEPEKSPLEQLEIHIRNIRHGGNAEYIREMVKSPDATPEVLERVLLDKNIYSFLREWAASHENAPVEALTKVMADRTDDRHVRYAAGENANTPVETLVAAFRDPKAWENEDLALGDLARNKRMPADVLSEMVLEHPPIREPGNLYPVERALQNPNIPTETLHAVMERMIEYREPDHPGPVNNNYTALGAVLRHPNTPAEDVQKVLFDKEEPDLRLRLAAMESPHTSVQDVIQILNDPTEKLGVNHGAYDALMREYRTTPSTDPNKAEIKAALIENYTDMRSVFPNNMASLEREAKRFQANKHADEVLGVTSKGEGEKAAPTEEISRKV